MVSLPMGQSARLDRRKRLSLLFYANGALSLKRRWTCEQGVLWTGAECGKRPLQPPSARREDSKVRRACPSTHTRTSHSHPQRRKPPPAQKQACGRGSVRGADPGSSTPRPGSPVSGGLSLRMVLFPHIHGDSAMSPRGAGTLHSRSPLSPRRVTTHGRSRRGQVHRARARALGRQPCASRGASSTSRPVPAADALASPQESLPGPARPP